MATIADIVDGIRRLPPRWRARIRSRIHGTVRISPWRMPLKSMLTPTEGRTGTRPADRQADVVDHLAGVDLEDQHLARRCGSLGQGRFGKRPQGDRPERADPDAVGPQLLDHVLDERAGGAERHDHVSASSQSMRLPALLGAGHLLELLGDVLPMLVRARARVRSALPMAHVQIWRDCPVPPRLPSSAQSLGGSGPKSTGSTSTLM